MKHSEAEHSETRPACELYWPHFFISIINLRYLKIKPTSGSPKKDQIRDLLS